ncbi:MAG: bifunctional adenosylcobinamide kinase/adenosylcobinamide-phosphate guanylyltransferase [Wujia sp.]
MLYLITGASGSGKSEYAEKLAVDLGKQYENKNSLLYVATMLSRKDAETEERIAKHRKQRAGMGFETLELPIGLEGLLRDVRVNKSSVILLECMSNLLANEMFEGEGRMKLEKIKCENNADFYHNNIVEERKIVEEYIISPCAGLTAGVGDLVIVTNEIFSDGRTYDELTEEYVRLLGYINTRLSAMADAVVEVVCGIPVVHKSVSHIKLEMSK